MKDRITTAIQRVQRYHFENGFFELMFGIIFFFCGVLVKPLPIPYIPPWLSIACLILTPFVVLYLWSRVVYPRSGYINNMPGTIKKRLSRIWPFLALEFLLALLIVSPMLLMDSGPNGDGGASWTTFTFGLVMSLFFGFLGFQSRLRRLAVVALISAGLAVVLSPLFIGSQSYIFSNPQIPYWVLYSSQIFITAYFLLMALVLTLSGGMAFLTYLHHNPLPLEMVHEQ